MASQRFSRKGTANGPFPMRYFCRRSRNEAYLLVKRPLFLMLVALAVLPLMAPWLAAEPPMAALLLRSFFSRLCHQDSTRSFQLEGAPVAVCTRCLGIYLGVAFGTILSFARTISPRSAMWWLGVGLILNGLDVATEMLAWHGNQPAARFWLGLFLGASAGAILSARTAYKSAR